jgi:hypothetical protein
VPARSRSDLDKLIEEATTDCYNEDEAATGFLTMLQDNLAVPFQAVVLGVDVTVEEVALNTAGEIVAMCTRGAHRQPIPIVDLPIPAETPEGVEWIAAYRRWRGQE